MTNCPECDASITIPDDAVEGEIVTCAECGASFELVKDSNGFGLKPAQTVERTGDSDLKNYSSL